MTHRGRVSKHKDGRGGWRFEIDTVDPATSKRRRIVRTGFKTKGDAASALENWRQEKPDGAITPAKAPRLGAYLEEWLSAIGPTLRPTTMALYRTMISAYIVKHIGGVKLADLNGATLSALYSKLRENLAPKTVRNVHGVIHRALKDAVEWDLIDSNPAALANVPRVPKTRPRTWNAAELGRFLDSVQGDRLAALWRLLATTGMRRGEVLGLRWNSVDFEHGAISVVEALTEYGGVLHHSEPKTDAGTRRIALDPVTVASLRDHRKRQLEERIGWGAGYQDLGFVFCREDGSPIRPALVTATLPKLAAAANLPSLTPHGLRHTWATLALTQGVHAKIVSERLGHSGIAITLEVYSHVLPGLDEAAAATVAAVVDGSHRG